MKAINTDLVGGVLGLALAVSFWLAREENWSFWSAVFPNVILAIIAGLSLLMLLKAALRPAVLPLFAGGSRRRMVVTAVIILAWAFAFSELGTLLSSFLAFAFLSAYLSRGHVELTPARALLGLALIAAELAVFYLIFVRVLHVPLPRGILL